MTEEEEEKKKRYVDEIMKQNTAPEQGLEEGDLIMDYVMPVRNLIAAPTKALGNVVLNAVKEKVRPNKPTPTTAYADTIKYDTKASPTGWGPKQPQVIARPTKEIPNEVTTWWNLVDKK